MSSFSERHYLDPWDVENYVYLRKGPIRRRSVCFDQAVKYASYQDDGFSPVYGSLVETNLKSGYNDYPVDFSPHNNQPQPSQCPSCHRDLSDYSSSSASEALYEDPVVRLQMERRRRKKRPAVGYEATMPTPRQAVGGMTLNTMGHLRLDYSINWNKLDRYVGRA